MNRDKILQQIKEQPEVSVLIIGGGINGLGTFRDLALQGIDVLLVERDDFCSGASAASSHMVHGGIRYLENGEFRLVREAVHERNRLIKNAPHYVKPLATTIPIFKWFSGILNAPLKFMNWLNTPSERGAIVIKLGLMMYDAYTKEQGKGTVPTHDFLGRSESLRQYPKLNPNIVATATYYDAAMPSPERIAIETMLDGEQANPQARALNYVSVIGGAGAEVFVRDELTGDELTIRPQLVINAAGPWIDFANQALGRPTNFIGGTKGSHLVLDHPELYEACQGHEIFFENDDGRIVLIYPIVKDRVIVGTTDIKIEDPDDAVCTDEERDYFFELIDKVFPTIAVNRSHIVYEFSGVRPLPSSDANTTGQISRDHLNRIVEPANGIEFTTYNLIGGKWTTFRAFAEQVADAALEHLGKTRQQSTADRPLPGGRDYPHTPDARDKWITAVVEETGIPAERIQILFERYGTYGREVARFMAAEEDQPLTHRPDYTVREVSYITSAEQVRHISDFIQRRSLLAMMGWLSYDLLVELSEIIGDTLGWSDAQKQEELGRVLDLLAAKHAVTFPIAKVP